ncbi:MAG TPA: ABC transporter permease [Vulgatibacter sp.]
MLVAFLLLPLVALLASTPLVGLVEGVAHPLVWPALRLSLLTSGASLLGVALLGTPLAWSLARSQGRLSRAIEAGVQLPIVIPPAVAGLAMLLAFGRKGLLGGGSIAFTTAAVVMAQTFVSAPFFVQAATSAFRRVDDRLIDVARTLGASPLRVFFRVGVPLALPGLVAGATMAWARALGEFGATLMFAGNLEGRTQTLPLAIYSALEVDLRAARALSIVLVIAAFTTLLISRAAWRRSSGDGAAP